MLKKILATALAAAMIFGLASTAFAAAFPDIAGNEFEADIAKLKALGLVEGDENGKYNPTNTINRAEFAKMVVNMLGLKSAASYLNTPTVFPDVKADFAWAYGYINIAVGRGLVKGYEDGTFRPSQPLGPKILSSGTFSAMSFCAVAIILTVFRIARLGASPTVGFAVVSNCRFPERDSPLHSE